MKKFSLLIALLLAGCASHNHTSSIEHSDAVMGGITPDQIAYLEKNKSTHLPVSFLNASLYYYNKGELDQSARYFVLGFMRAQEDSLGCYEDSSAQSGAMYNILSSFYLRLDSRKSDKLYSFFKKAHAQMDSLFQENDIIGYDYDRRWPYKSGLRMFIDIGRGFQFATNEMHQKNKVKAKTFIKKYIEREMQQHSPKKRHKNS